MSLWRDELKPAAGTVACLLALAAVAVASLSRVIEAPGYLGWAIAALVIGAAFALYFGPRSLGLAFGLLFIFAASTLPALFVPDDATALLPTPDAYAAVRKLIASGFAAIPKVTPPVAAEPRFTILVWVSLLLLGYLGAAWVVVRRPVGAVISALAVVTFAGSVGDGVHRTTFAVAAVAATGAFFLAEGRHRIARWGGGRISIPAWLGVPTLVVATLLAIGVPRVLGETPIIKLQSAIRPRIVIIKPLSDIRRQLKVDPPREVMRVSSSRATYWRLTGLDAYDGREWVLEARPREIREGIIPAPKPPTNGEILEQQYRLTSLLAPWLPAAYAAETIDASSPVQVDPGSQTLLLRDETEPGLSYVVRSRLPRVDVNMAAEAEDVDDERAKLFGNKARPIVEGTRTPLDTARRLEAHFRRYTYDEDVDAGHTVDRLERFLAERRGYCEQFAATMTLMLRGLGINARVGVGFLPGRIAGGEYVVTTRDAHAWVEADIPGAGWYAFDPTPGRGDAFGAQEEEQQIPPEPTAAPEPTAVPRVTPAPDELPEDVAEQSVPSRIPEIVGWSALAVFLIGIVPGAKAFRRSRRRRGTPEAMVVGAYAELVDTARDLGWRIRGSETQREFVARAARGEQRTQDEGLLLASLAGRALFAPGGSGADDPAAAWSASHNARGALRRRAPAWRRIVAIFDPRTFVPDTALRRARTRVAAAFSR